MSRTSTFRTARSVQASGVLAALLLLSAAGQAHAQAAPADDGTDPGAAEPSATEGDVILVTARRRVENVQDVPISISVLGGNRLEQTNAVTLDQIKQLAPSLQIFAINPRNTSINIRNLGSNASATSDGLDPGVGVYIDDVYYARPGQSVFDLVDIDRVEILKGPQGTLFGRNTTAGAISIATRAPTFDLEGTAEVSYGNYNYVQARAAVSIPLVADTLAVRLTGSTSYRNGFIHNVRTGANIHDLNSQAVRGQILFKPSESFTLRIIGDYSIRKEDCCVSLIAGAATTLPNGTAISGNVVQRFTALGYTPPSLNAFDRITDVDADASYSVKQAGVSANAEWQGDGFSIKSITALRTWDWRPSNDSDALGLSVLKRLQSTQKQKQFSQELRISSEGERTIDYVAGLYYFYQSLPQSQVTEYGADAALYSLPLATDPIVANAALNGFTTNAVSDLKTWSYAVFGQVNWHIDPRLTLTVGARFTHEKKQGSFDQRQIAGIDLSTLSPGDAATAQGIRNQFGRANSFAETVKQDNLSGQVSLAYKPNDHVLAYATYARGAKSGGLNIGNLPAGISPIIGPEAVNHFELGLKTSPVRGVTLNGALFWTEINGFQATYSEANPPRSYLTNAAKVRSRGGEIDLNVNALDQATFYASAVYADASYVSYPQASCPLGATGVGGICDLSGETLPNTPKWTLSAGGEIWQPAGGAEFYLGTDWSYRSSINSSTNNSPFGVIPGYSVVNARAGIRAGNRSWDVYVWARNLLDNDYYLNYGYSNIGLVTARIGDPRTFGLTGRFKM